MALYDAPRFKSHKVEVPVAFFESTKGFFTPYGLGETTPIGRDTKFWGIAASVAVGVFGTFYILGKVFGKKKIFG